jgi:hypothetical protein
MRGAHLFKHGMFGTSTHTVWRKMLERCAKPYCADFPRYGGRGIAVCERWHDFKNFFADMGERPDGLTLDRIDVNGNYEPSNCRWVDRTTQNRNRRDNVLLTHNGITAPIAEWAERIGMKKGSLWHRINAGWPVEKALSTPTNHRK